MKNINKDKHYILSLIFSIMNDNDNKNDGDYPHYRKYHVDI